MARLSIVLGIVLIMGLVVLGTVQEVMDIPSSNLAGAATSDSPDQRQINLCMNECMRGCVVELDDNRPCTHECEKMCGVTHAK